MELDNLGKEIELPSAYKGGPTRKVNVIMVIKTPRGIMRLFELDYEHRHLIDAQCEAIRAFMEQDSMLASYEGGRLDKYIQDNYGFGNYKKQIQTRIKKGCG